MGLIGDAGGGALDRVGAGQGVLRGRAVSSVRTSIARPLLTGSLIPMTKNLDAGYPLAIAVDHRDRASGAAAPQTETDVGDVYRNKVLCILPCCCASLIRSRAEIFVLIHCEDVVVIGGVGR